jgi:hypothetical protein
MLESHVVKVIGVVMNHDVGMRYPCTSLIGCNPKKAYKLVVVIQLFFDIEVGVTPLHHDEPLE